MCQMAVNAENIMKRKELYTAPAILEEIELEMSGTILAQSVVNKETVVESVGQDVENFDLSGDDWTQKWE